MKLVALIKNVPDTEAKIKINADGNDIETQGIKFVMNPYDEFAVEEGLKLKEKNGGDVTIVTLGPGRAMETIRTALAMGAEKGVHISEENFDDDCAYSKASTLAAAIREIPYDIILCGQRAIDDDEGPVSYTHLTLPTN